MIRLTTVSTAPPTPTVLTLVTPTVSVHQNRGVTLLHNRVTLPTTNRVITTNRITPIEGGGEDQIEVHSGVVRTNTGGEEEEILPLDITQETQEVTCSTPQHLEVAVISTLRW